MFEKIKQKKEENKKVLVGAGIIGGVVLLGLAYRQGMIKGVAKGAYLGGFYIGQKIGAAHKNGVLDDETFKKVYEVVTSDLRR